jgi:hypothetical protein
MMESKNLTINVEREETEMNITTDGFDLAKTSFMLSVLIPQNQAPW